MASVVVDLSEVIPLLGRHQVNSAMELLDGGVLGVHVTPVNGNDAVQAARNGGHAGLEAHDVGGELSSAGISGGGVAAKGLGDAGCGTDVLLLLNACVGMVVVDGVLELTEEQVPAFFFDSLLVVPGISVGVGNVLMGLNGMIHPRNSAASLSGTSLCIKWPAGEFGFNSIEDAVSEFLDVAIVREGDGIGLHGEGVDVGLDDLGVVRHVISVAKGKGLAEVLDDNFIGGVRSGLGLRNVGLQLSLRGVDGLLVVGDGRELESGSRCVAKEAGDLVFHIL